MTKKASCHHYNVYGVNIKSKKGSGSGIAYRMGIKLSPLIAIVSTARLQVRTNVNTSMIELNLYKPFIG